MKPVKSTLTNWSRAAAFGRLSVETLDDVATLVKAAQPPSGG